MGLNLQNKRKNIDLSDRWGFAEQQEEQFVRRMGLCRTPGRAMIYQTDGALQNNRKNGDSSDVGGLQNKRKNGDSSDAGGLQNNRDNNDSSGIFRRISTLAGQQE